MITVRDIIGDSLEEDFLSFDLTEIQQILNQLQHQTSHDIVHAENLQQKTLRGADIISEYLSKIVKTVTYLKSRINTVKNKVSLDYQAASGKTTADMKKWAGESSQEVADIYEKLSKAEATKVVLEKKYEIIIRAHYFYKEIASGFRRTLNGNFTPPQEEKNAPSPTEEKGTSWENI